MNDMQLTNMYIDSDAIRMANLEGNSALLEMFNSITSERWVQLTQVQRQLIYNSLVKASVLKVYDNMVEPLQTGSVNEFFGDVESDSEEDDDSDEGEA